MNKQTIIYAAITAFLLVAAYLHDPWMLDEVINDEDYYAGYHLKDGQVRHNKEIIAEADAETFTLYAHPNGLYARDKSRLYCRGKALAGVKPDDFVILSTWYGVTPEMAYYDCRPMAGVDAQKLTVYMRRHFEFYAHDGQTVYYQGHPVPGAEVGSFTIHGDYYGRDASREYYKGEVLTSAQKSKLQSKDNWYWLSEDNPYSKSAGLVFYRGRILEGADAPSFKLSYADNPSGLVAGTDRDTLWVADRPFKIGGDVKEFGQREETQWYLGRAGAVVIGKNGEIVQPEVDYSQFKLINSGPYAKDDKRVFFKTSLMPRADAPSFIHLSAAVALPSLCENTYPQRRCRELALDRNHIYHDQEPAFTFVGPMTLLWPPDVGSERRHEYNKLLLFKDDDGVTLVEYRPDGWGRREVFTRLTTESKGFRILAALRPHPAVGYDVLVSTDGSKLWYNDYILNGLATESVQPFETQYWSGAMADNGLLLSGHGLLTLRHKDTGETVRVGQNGWQSASFATDRWSEQEAVFFDGRFQVRIAEDIHIREGEDGPLDNPWQPLPQPEALEFNAAVPVAGNSGAGSPVEEGKP